MHVHDRLALVQPDICALPVIVEQHGWQSIQRKALTSDQGVSGKLMSETLPLLIYVSEQVVVNRAVGSRDDDCGFALAIL